MKDTLGDRMKGYYEDRTRTFTQDRDFLSSKIPTV